eukprot:TRINITY_DN5225_c0_g1_i1.p1 TRINITY_DN5225_c0_g1~~TRINITY_DN5225_c0_g1_i1.p1  ORF type:complete len:519 (+),score=98.68 TRINITY_DN5225_c0_g1_i1:97-1653(+)
MLGSALYKGGVLMMIAGGVMNWVSDWFLQFTSFIWMQMSVSVDIQQSQDAYLWLMDYLGKHQRQLLTTQKLTVSVHQKMTYHDIHKKAQNMEVVSQERPKLKYRPGAGMHIMWYKSSLLFISRAITRLQTDPYGRHMRGAERTKESLHVWKFGRSKAPIEALVEEAMSNTFETDKGQTIIYAVDESGTWNRSVSRDRRLMSSVILDPGITNDIMEDAKEFLASADWYRSLGIPYRRTYLLHGPPGCGKTSFVSALAGSLGLDVSVITLSEENLDDVSVNRNLLEAPANSIILLEDVDAAFLSREQEEALERAKASGQWWRTQRVTFSGLINAIDGIASQEGRIFVMTTNHKKRLDPALLRPGRVDRDVHFPLASQAQSRGMFLRFYPDELDLATEFAEKVGPNHASMALLQGYFLAYKSDATAAFRNVTELQQHIESEEKAKRKKKEERKRAREEEQAKNDVADLVKSLNAHAGGGRDDSGLVNEASNGEPLIDKGKEKTTGDEAAPEAGEAKGVEAN